jgi:type II secretion system protein N
MVDNASAPLREKLALAVLYTLVFVSVFTLALYWTFPYERLRDFAMSHASTPADATGGGRSVQIGELRPVGLTGIVLRDVEITQDSTTADTPPSVLRLSSISAQLSPWALLFGGQDVTVHAAAGGGKFDGSFKKNADSQHIQADLTKFDIAQAGLGSFVGLPLKGKASGTIDLNLTSDVSKATGNIKLEIRNLHISDGKAKLKLPALGGAGLTLDELDAGKLELTVEMHDGVATIKHMATDGRDLKLSGKGNIRLAEPLGRSRPDIDLDLNVSDVYKNKSDRSKAMFELIGMRPEWQHATTPQGTMHVHLGGTFLALRGGPGK